MSLINSTAIPSGATDYEIEQSLRFEHSSSAYLSRTPASAGNRRTWTWSAWVKRGDLVLSGQPVMFGAGTSGSAFSMFYFNKNTSTLLFYDYDGSTDYGWEAEPLLRDPSAWYHIMCVYDSTNSTAADRLKIYVNGVQYTVRGTDYGNFPLNYETHINATSEHNIGKYPGNTQYYDGYLGEVNFIDGAAKVPADFAETGTYGEWKPKKYSGSYGTNGFYLPFKQDYTVEGFSTVTYRGNGASQYIGGVGFQSDLTWFKKRSASQNHALVDAVRGNTKWLESDGTGAEQTFANNNVTISADGIALDYNGGYNNINQSSQTYVVWNWDMGGSNANNTAGSINSVVRANPTYGQSIVSYTGTGSNATIGHGLSAAPDFIIVKTRSNTGDWMVYSGDATDFLKLNETNATEDLAAVWNDTSPTSTLFSLGSNGDVNTSGRTYIAYCFTSVAGYSKFGSYQANDSATGPTITTGFKPAFVMIKCTSDGGSDRDWTMFDNTRSPTNTINLNLKANEASAENANSRVPLIDFNDTNFQLRSSHGETNGGSETYIYMAFADKREYAYWLDQSGKNNDWTSNNLTESDVMVDSPTNNFATFNPLTKRPAANGLLAEGNLKYTTHTGDSNVFTTMGILPDQKVYFEVYLQANSNQNFIGISNLIDNGDGSFAKGGSETGSYGRKVRGAANVQQYFNNGSETNLGVNNVAAGVIVGVAVDNENGKVHYAFNNTYDSDPTDNNPAADVTGFNTSVTQFPQFSADTPNNTVINFLNFGQDSSFAGTKTAQGNQDSNNIGDFYYTPPTGYLALCTSNLPDVSVTPSENFNTVLYTGDGSQEVVTGVGFQPDWIWVKARNTVVNHKAFDAARGLGSLRPNTTGAEDTNTSENLTSYNSDGFTIKDPDYTGNNRTIAAWNWKANGSGSTNTNGSINTTKTSANVDAGFSISTYTGTGSNATVGHGLSVAPEMIIVKRRSAADGWGVYHSSLGATKVTNLDESGAPYTYSTGWNNTAPTTEVFSVGTWGGSNASSSTYVAYCFHSVDGYSKVGSYTSNQSADGPFVYTGFRPAYVLAKMAVGGTSWRIMDNKRDGYNANNHFLMANSTAVENTSSEIDFLSNGFKLRGAGDINYGTYEVIYIAFAESPFKYSNAR